MNKSLFTAIAVLGAQTASAAPVDLSSWLAEGSSNYSWVVASDNNSVRQTRNSYPTVFHNNENSQGKELRGTITVNTSGDDDFIGFVLGYQAGDLASGSTGQDYILIDWKQSDQILATENARAGLAASRVTTRLVENDTSWAHLSPDVEELARGTNLGSTGWVDYQTYEFALTFSATLIEVFVDGTKEISLTGSFADGAFGFYNSSQDNVTYAGLQEDVLPPAPVPLPAGFPLLLAGIGGLGVLRARKRR